MKGWADHCSSDDESLDEDLDTGAETGDYNHPDDEPLEGEGDEGPPKKVFDWPSEPPFTAYVGNLAYTIDEPSQLADEIVKIAKVHLGMDVNVVDSRLAMVRRDDRGRDNQQQQQNKHRGFGYIQLETLEQLKAVVEGLQGQKVSGRPIQLDTANQSYVGGGRRQQHGQRDNNGGRQEGKDFPDGSKFRGGRYANKSHESNETEIPAHPRSHLKLQPRSKPVAQDDKGAGASGGSNIFGGGRARDEQKHLGQDNRKGSRGAGAGDDRRGGRGGRGGRADGRGAGRDSAVGRGGGRGRGADGAAGRGAGPSKQENNWRGAGPAKQEEKKTKGAGRDGASGRGTGPAKQEDNWHGAGPNKQEEKKTRQQEKKIKHEEKKTKQEETAAAAPAVKSTEKSVVNKFAALDFGDDSD
jgi:hypothetical protein